MCPISSHELKLRLLRDKHFYVNVHRPATLGMESSCCFSFLFSMHHYLISFILYYIFIIFPFIAVLPVCGKVAGLQHLIHCWVDWRECTNLSLMMPLILHTTSARVPKINEYRLRTQRSSAFGQGLLPPAAPEGAVVPCPLLPACRCLLLRPCRCPPVMSTLYHFCKPPIGSSPRTLCLPLRFFLVPLLVCSPWFQVGLLLHCPGVARAGSKHSSWLGLVPGLLL